MPAPASANDQVPASQAGSIEIWGYEADVPVRQSIASDPQAWRGVGGSGAALDNNAYAIRADGRLSRINDNGNAALAVPTALADRQFISVDSYATVVGGVTSDGIPHLWGNARGLDLTAMPTTTAALGGTATAIRVGTTAIAVRLDNGKVGVLSSHGYELPEELTNVAEIDLRADFLAARTTSGGMLGWTTSGLATGWPAAVTGTPADPVIDFELGTDLVAVTAAGVVHEWQVNGEPRTNTFPGGLDGKVVQVAATGSNWLAARTDEDEVVVWGPTTEGSVHEAMSTVPEEVAGQDIATIEAGVNTFRVIVADPLPPLSVTTPGAISGTPQVGKTLTGTPAVFAGSPDAIANQWLADNEVIPGATGTTLTLTSDHLGDTITFRSTATRGDDTPVVSTSSPVGPVAAAPAKVASSTAVAVSPASAGYGTARTVTVTVTKAGGTPTGTVSVKVGAATLSGTLSAGKTTVAVPATQPVGTHAVTASYAGDETTNASTGTGQVVVAKAASSTKVTKVKVVKAGKKVQVQLKVTTPAGVSPAGTVKIVVKKGSKKVVSKTVTVNAAGVAKLTAKKLAKGKYSVAAAYAGSATVAPSTGKKSFKV